MVERFSDTEARGRGELDPTETVEASLNTIKEGVGLLWPFVCGGPASPAAPALFVCSEFVSATFADK